MIRQYNKDATKFVSIENTEGGNYLCKLVAVTKNEAGLAISENVMEEQVYLSLEPCLQWTRSRILPGNL